MTVTVLYNKFLSFYTNSDSNVNDVNLEAQFGANEYLKRVMNAYKAASAAERLLEPFQGVIVLLWDNVRGVPAPVFDLVSSFEPYTIMLQYYDAVIADPNYIKKYMMPLDDSCYLPSYWSSISINNFIECPQGHYCPKKSSVQVGW